MATTTFQAAPYNDTENDWKAWCAAISTAMSDIGFVQTGDTGQVDWGTATNPGHYNTVAGYEIWRFDDDLQTIAPLFMKFNYYGATAASPPRLSLSIGKSSDGSGRLANVLLEDTHVGAYAASGASLTSSNVMTGYASSGDGSMLTMFPFASGGETRHAQVGFIVDRSRDQAGNPTSAGLVVAHEASVNRGLGEGIATTHRPANLFHAISYTNAGRNEGVIPAVIPYIYSGTNIGGSSSLGSANAPVLPWLAVPPSGAPWQALAGVSYAPGDDPGGVFTLRVLGRDRTYRSIPITGQHCAWGIAYKGDTYLKSTRVGVAILWE